MKPSTRVALGGVQQTNFDGPTIHHLNKFRLLGLDRSVPNLLISKKVKIGWWKIRPYLMDVVKVELKKNGI
jgi:hypothetical protein